ncbi:type I-E CRISPR-associated endoribonuclease Cas2 [Streptomyces sp. ST1020]|nr:type I-E CRISPR-associated endoribonuclease Cas2 [Streptomyces sp. ST1020]
MFVIATTAVPDHLRGALSRWTTEVMGPDAGCPMTSTGLHSCG